MNKEKLKEFKRKLSIFSQKVKNFKITKYLLDRKEDKVLAIILEQKDLIELHNERILSMGRLIEESEGIITGAEKTIKKLELDIKKIVKVINLYIV